MGSEGAGERGHGRATEKGLRGPYVMWDWDQLSHLHGKFFPPSWLYRPRLPTAWDVMGCL